MRVCVYGALGDDFQGQNALFVPFSTINHEDEAGQDLAWEKFKADLEALLLCYPGHPETANGRRRRRKQSKTHAVFCAAEREKDDLTAALRS